MSNKFYKIFQNICSIIVIIICILSLIRFGNSITSIFPILMIILQIIVLILNNKKKQKLND